MNLKAIFLTSKPSYSWLICCNPFAYLWLYLSKYTLFVSCCILTWCNQLSCLLLYDGGFPIWPPSCNCVHFWILIFETSLCFCTLMLSISKCSVHQYILWRIFCHMILWLWIKNYLKWHRGSWLSLVSACCYRFDVLWIENCLKWHRGSWLSSAFTCCCRFDERPLIWHLCWWLWKIDIEDFVLLIVRCYYFACLLSLHNLLCLRLFLYFLCLLTVALIVILLLLEWN